MTLDAKVKTQLTINIIVLVTMIPQLIGGIMHSYHLHNKYVTQRILKLTKLTVSTAETIPEMVWVFPVPGGP